MPSNPIHTRPQFSLFSLFALTLLFGVVFGLLAAMGAPPLQAMLAFALFGGIAATVAVAVEGCALLPGARRRGG